MKTPSASGKSSVESRGESRVESGGKSRGESKFEPRIELGLPEDFLDGWKDFFIRHGVNVVSVSEAKERGAFYLRHLIGSQSQSNVRNQARGLIRNQTHGIETSAQDGEGFELVSPSGLNFHIDFSKQHQLYQRKILSPRKELIAKALGLKAGSFAAQPEAAQPLGGEGLNRQKVLDLTAGLAQDAVFMTQLGFQVCAVERNPVLYFFLQIAWEKANDELKQALRFQFGEALEILKGLQNINHADAEKYNAIYFDPMYPEKKKTALPRKEMQIFKALVGGDIDSQQVFDQIQNASVPRIVVKRPVHAESLVFKSPEKEQKFHLSHSIDGKLVRYDVYLRVDRKKELP